MLFHCIIPPRFETGKNAWYPAGGLEIVLQFLVHTLAYKFTARQLVGGPLSIEPSSPIDTIATRARSLNDHRQKACVEVVAHGAQAGADARSPVLFFQPYAPNRY